MSRDLARRHTSAQKRGRLHIGGKFALHALSYTALCLGYSRSAATVPACRLVLLDTCSGCPQQLCVMSMFCSMCYKSIGL